MDEKEIVNGILSVDPDITIIDEEDGISYFELFGSEYGIRYFPDEKRALFPKIVVRKYEEYDCPHIMTYEYKIHDDICRSICLYEDEKFVKHLYSYEEKICMTIDRLKELLQLTEREKEEEYQKEFLHYWNEETETIVDVYIGQERCFQKLNLYQNTSESNDVRFVSNGVKLNNTDKYKHIPNIEGIYIPITDNRRILPPVKGKPWTIKEVLNIIDGKPFSRISKDTFNKLSSEKSKASHILLIFEMMIDNQSYNFGVLIEFNYTEKVNLLERFKKSTKSITACAVNRCDYYFLNRQIGNDISLMGKNIAVVGCGSLGSYVSEDLVKAGINKISLYDSDTFVSSNGLRHKAPFSWKGYRKVTCMKGKLEAIHPEIFVEINGNMTDTTLKEYMGKHDLIIFTVGSSDVQLSLNRVLKEEKYEKTVIYTWLEAGGVYSHILVVDYSKKGCYECLFTDCNGEFTNNKANKLSEELSESYTLRNGCGATRVAYGTAILLRTTSVLLDIVQNIFSGKDKENYLIDIDNNQVINKENLFWEGMCSCCGDRNKEEMYQNESS